MQMYRAVNNFCSAYYRFVLFAFAIPCVHALEFGVNVCKRLSLCVLNHILPIRSRTNVRKNASNKTHTPRRSTPIHSARSVFLEINYSELFLNGVQSVMQLPYRSLKWAALKYRVFFCIHGECYFQNGTARQCIFYCISCLLLIKNDDFVHFSHRHFVSNQLCIVVRRIEIIIEIV